MGVSSWAFLPTNDKGGGVLPFGFGEESMSEGLDKVRGKLAPVSDVVGVATAEERIGRKGAGGGVDDRQVDGEAF
jgi:hypothetical protein